MEEERTVCECKTECPADESSPEDYIEVNTNAQDESGYTCVHKAVNETREAVLDALLSQNVNIETRNKEGETPLMLAVKCGNRMLVEKLVKKGANVDCEDDDYATPLLQAVKCNCEYTVRLLLNNGASCLVENMAFETPLHTAILNNFESLFDLLIKAGADVNHMSGIHGTPLQAALYVGNLRIARKLLANGASLSPHSVFSSLLKCYKESFSTLMDFVLESGFDVNTKGPENWTLLHIAITKVNVTVVNKLLQKGANVNVKDKLGEKPLHFVVRYSSSSEILKLLLKYRCDVNAVAVNGETALHIAVKSFCVENTRILLNAGADMNIPCNYGRSPLALSFESRTFARKVSSYMVCARKMDLAKVRINLTQNDGKWPKNFTTLCAYDVECLEELDEIKMKKFGDLSLYNIFSDCDDPVFASNCDMKAYVKSDTLKSDFPLYANLLRRKFKDGVKRNVLLDGVSLSVKIVQDLNVSHIVLPSEMSRKVLVYLENCDILNVKKAFGIDNESQLKL